MRKSTCLLPNVLLAVALGIALCVCPQSAVHAQGEGVLPASHQSGGFFSRDLGTALRFNYHTQGYGTQDGVFSLGGMKVFNMEGATAFLDGQGTLSDDFGGGFNLGVGYRQLASLGTSFDPERIMGVGFWTDGQSSANDNFFAQLGFSLESLGEIYDLRLNGHFPLEREKNGDATLIDGGSQFYVGNNLFGASESFGVDTALDVLDGELAVRVADLEAWAFAGAYYLGGGDDDTGGYRVGVRGYAVPDLAVSFAVTEDDIYDANFLFGITWFIGRTHKGNAPCGTLLDRFREPVLRNDFIAMTSRQETRASGNALTIAGTTDPVRIVHVDSGAAAGGDGTFENPYDAIADASGMGSSEVGDLILVHGGSTFDGTSGRIALQENQRLLGEGRDQDMNTVTHFVQTNIGDVALPETAMDAQMLNRPSIDGAGSVGSIITLADGSAVDNFTIRNAETAISADGIAVPTGDTIANVVIENSSVAGVSLTEVTGAAVLNANVQINGTAAGGTALLVDGGDESVSMFGSINDTSGNSVVVRNRTGGTVLFAGTIDDDASTSMGVLIEDNADATVNFNNASTLNIETAAAGDIGFTVQGNTNTTVTASGVSDFTGTGDGQGLLFAGNDADTSMTFADLNATAVNGDTVTVIGEGTVTLSSADDTRMIENTGTGNAFLNNGAIVAPFAAGTAVVTVNSNVASSGGGSAVTIMNRMDPNDITFTGTVDATTESAGIVASGNMDGNIIFTNTLTLNSGDSNAIVLTGNTGATLSFSDLDIDTNNGSGFVATGGGNLIVTSTNGTNDINVTGTGVGVNLDNMTIDAANVTFDVVNVGSGAGVGINLANLDGDGQVVIGGGTNAGDGGALTTTGTAINVDNANNVAITNVTVTNAGAAQGLVVNNQDAGSSATFAGLNVNTDNGDAVTVGENGAMGNLDGTITFTDLTVNTIGDGDGIVVDNDDASTAAITFTDVAADIEDNPANTDVAKGFVATGGGTITVNGTNTIDSAADTAFEATNVRSLTASNVTINNTAGRGVVVAEQATAGDSVTLNNFDVTTADADAVTVGDAMLANGNSDGTVILNNLTAEATGMGNAVVADNNTGAIVSLNAVTATADSGNAFSATNGGTLIATGANNLTSDTGQGLNIEDMTIDAAGATFASVDVTNGTAGVNLSNLTGGAVTVNGGTMTTSGTALSVTNVDDAALNNITVNNTTAAGLVANNAAGDELTVSNLDVTTTMASGVEVTGGTFAATGNNTITTTTGTGLNLTNTTIDGAGAAFNSVDVNGATNGIILTDATGGLIRVGGAAATGVDGAGGTLVTEQTAILVTGVTNAVFNDVATEVTTGAFNGVEVDHTIGAASSVVFNNLTHTTSNTGGGVQVTDNGTGELDFTLRDSNLDVDAADSFGFNLVTGNNAGEVDIRLDNNLIVAANNSAVSAAITAGTGDIQFSVTGGNDWTNNSAANATVDFNLTADRTLNATIGDRVGTAPFDENRFVNGNVGGTAFAAESNSAAGTLSLDLRGNTATGGATDFLLTETLGTFGVVDRDATITAETNNAGGVDIGGGGVVGDFDDLGSVKQVD